MQSSKKKLKESIFDSLDDKEYQNFKLWNKKSAPEIPKEMPLSKQGILFKKGRKKGNWKQYLVKLYGHYLIKYRADDTSKIKGWQDIKNFRLEKPVKVQVKDQSLYGFRLIHNQKCIELYEQSKETCLIWGALLSRFTVQTNFNQDYKTIKLLGKGNFAKVYYARSLNNGYEYAVKAFDKAKFADIATDRPALIKELDILRVMDHKGVIKLYEVYEDEDLIYLVMELLRGGELFKRLQGRGIFNEEYCANLLYNLVGGLAYVHTRNVLHRDIKPENLLLREKEGEFDIVVADFGLSDFYDPKGNYMFKRCGTPGYVAPEVLADKIYDVKVDSFSCGVIMFIILTGSSPFKGKSYDEIVMKNYTCEIDFKTKDMHKRLSPEAYDLVQHLLEKDPKKRWSCEKALGHPWFQKKANEVIPKKEEEEVFQCPSPGPRPGQTSQQKLYCPSPVMKHMTNYERPEDFDSPNTFKSKNGKKTKKLQAELLLQYCGDTTDKANDQKSPQKSPPKEQKKQFDQEFDSDEECMSPCLRSEGGSPMQSPKQKKSHGDQQMNFKLQQVSNDDEGSPVKNNMAKLQQYDNEKGSPTRKSSGKDSPVKKKAESPTKVDQTKKVTNKLKDLV